MTKSRRQTDTVSGEAAARRRGHRAGERGASLLEILVILVILLLGIFAVIRIFPVGLGTLRTTESRTLASQLASQQDEQLKSDAGNLPQGVLLAYYDSANKRAFDATQDPDDLRPYAPGGDISADNAAVNPYYADVNRYRYIEGEGAKVPTAVNVNVNTAAYAGTVNGGIYLLKFGPIFLPQGYESLSATQFDDYLRVYGPTLLGVQAPYETTGSGDNSTAVQSYLQGDQTYLIDYGDPNGGTTAHILFPADAANKTFFITFSYMNGSTVAFKDKFQIVAKGGVWQDITDTTTGTTYSTLVTGSEQVNREFTRLSMTSSGVTWSNDPYEYALLEDNFAINGGSSPTFANLGRIAFNPVGANYALKTPSGQQAFTAYADYSVLDWHILRDDREVPSGTPLQLTGGQNAEVIRTTLGNLKQKGEPNPDNTIYDGMFGPKTDDLILVNLTTGQELAPGDYVAGSPVDPNKDYWVDSSDTGTYRNGTIYINTDRVPQGTHLRVLYKADGDWAVSVQKAYSRYLHIDSNPASPTGFPPINDPRAFTLSTGTAGAGGVEPTFLIFNLSEYNKSFVARLQYVKLVNGNNITVQTVPEQITLDATPSAGLSGHEVVAEDVSKYMPDRVAGTAWSVVGDSVTGVSIKTRVIYRDSNSNAPGGATNTTADPNAGWRIHDLDTYLTVAQGLQEQQ